MRLFKFLFLLLIPVCLPLAQGTNKPQPQAQPQTAAKDDSARIRIAIPKFERVGDIPEGNWKQINNIILNSFINNKTFEVVERNEEAIQAMAKEAEFQTQGNLVDANSDQLIKYGRIQGVRQLLLGSLGNLFGKLVITVRLVDAENGKNLFATTLATDEKQFFVEIERLAVSISSKALESSRVVTKEEILAYYKADKFSETNDAIEAYRLKKALDPELESIWKVVIPKLSKDLYEQAERATNEKNYRKARELVERALAFQIEDRTVQLRSRIIREETVFEKEKAEQEIIDKEKLELQARRRLADSVADPFESTDAYFKQLSPLGHHVGLSLTKEVASDLVLPDGWGEWGVDYFGIFRFPGQEPDPRGAVEVSSISYFGSGIQYFQNRNPLRLMAHAYFSPSFGVSLKLANLIQNIGLDAGALVVMDNSLAGGYAGAFTLGALEVLELRVVRSLGVFASLKADYLYFPYADNHHQFLVRFAGGISF